MRLTIIRGLIFIGIVGPCLTAIPARANLFTHILREAGEAGGKASTHGLSHLGLAGKAAAHLKSLGNAPKGALAAHATPEGHWQFVNRDGQVFTAGTAEEIKRAVPTLAPDAISAGETKLLLYVSEDSVFQNRAALDALPKDAELHVVTDSGAYAVTRTGSGASTILRAQIKPNLIATLGERALFDETLSYLGRNLNKSNIRTLALEPGAATRLSSAPKLDAASKSPLVDQIDPASLDAALGSIRGQTALITGRVENGKLMISPSTGADISREMSELIDAARRNDVNLVVLRTESTRQPGGRNWLWQTVEVGGLQDATKTATFGDFLDAIAARRGGFEISAAHDDGGRIHLAAVPSGGETGVVGNASTLLEEAVGHVTGEIVTAAVDVHGRDAETQSEYDARLIPGIPVYIQVPYLLSWIAGIIAWPTVRGWWHRLWAPPPALASQQRFKRLLGAVPRETVYWLAFLPLSGIPALIWHFTVQIWLATTAPFRWIHRRFLRREV